MSPVIREQHDEFPMICDAKGRITFRKLDRVSPLAIPILLEVGREAVFGEAMDALIGEAAEQLIAEAGLH